MKVSDWNFLWNKIDKETVFTVLWCAEFFRRGRSFLMEPKKHRVVLALSIRGKNEVVGRKT